MNATRSTGVGQPHSAATGTDRPARSRQTLKAAIGVLVTVACLLAAFWRIDFHVFLASVAAADVWLLLLSPLVGLASFNVRALRWQQMLAPIKGVGYMRAYHVLMVGFLANSILPARAGEFIRAHMLGRQEHVSRATVLGTIVLERLVDMCVLLALSAAAVALYPFPDETRRSVLGVLGLTVVAIAAFVVVACLRERMPRLGAWLLLACPSRFRERLRSIMRSMIDGGRFLPDPRRATGVAGLTVAVWAIVLVSVWISLRAMHLDVPPAVAGLVLAATAVGLLAPATAGGLGTFELAVVVVLGYAGVERSEAAAYAVVLHVIQLVPVCMVGLVSAWCCQRGGTEPATTVREVG